MKLRNKKTGEIGNLMPYGGEDGKIWVWIDNKSRPEYRYNSLAGLNKEWEDYEEPKEYWAIDCFVPDDDLVSQFSNCSESVIENRKSIGNYFETEEEAEKAVEKLKAWKRLKDKGFKFDKWNNTSAGPYMPIWFYFEEDTLLEDIKSDLDLLFGGKE